MRRSKENHRGYGSFWGVFLLLAISAATSVHADTSSTKEAALLNDTLKSQTHVMDSQTRDTTLVIRDYVPIRSDEPLYIVNGIELSSDIFAALNPNYIESLEVLRDASATAIYGTRGINGVIIIKLKSREQMREERVAKRIDNLLDSKGVNKRSARYYINGKEVPASTAYQTDIEQMEVKTGSDGILEIYIKPVIYIRGEYE